MARRVIPRYVNTTSGTRLLYTETWQLFLWSRKNVRNGTKRGVCLKRKKGKQIQHTMLTWMKYNSHEKYCGTVRHFELCRHMSTKWFQGRVSGSKRYLRFKVCL